MKVKYYLTNSGRSPVEEFLRDQSKDIQSDYLVAGAKLSLAGAKWPKDEASEAQNERRRT